MDLELEPRVPPETPLCKYRHLPEAHALGTQIFELIQQYLVQRGCRLRQGTVLDATRIDTPASTQNQKGQRDPEMHSMRHGRQWPCGMKLCIGIDRQTGLIHHLVTSPAQVHDRQRAPRLLQAAETAGRGDTAFGDQEAHMRAVVPHLTPRLQIKRPRGWTLTRMQRPDHGPPPRSYGAPLPGNQGNFRFSQSALPGVAPEHPMLLRTLSLGQPVPGPPPLAMRPVGRWRLSCARVAPTSHHLAPAQSLPALLSPPHQSEADTRTRHSQIPFIRVSLYPIVGFFRSKDSSARGAQILGFLQ